MQIKSKKQDKYNIAPEINHNDKLGYVYKQMIKHRYK